MAVPKGRFPLVRLLYLLLCISLVPLTNATCYGLDGNKMEPQFQPCSNVAGSISVCCATNRTNYFGGSSFHGPTADKCLPNGLCQNIQVYSPSVTYVQYWRNGCTSTPVDDKGCLNVCIRPQQVIGGGFAQMTPCDGTANSTTWCCGTNNTCCGTASEVTLAATLGAPLPSSSTASSSINTTTASPTALTSSEPNESAGDRRTSLSPGAIAGIVISATIAVLALLALLILGRRLKKRRAERGDDRSGANALNISVGYSTVPSNNNNTLSEHPSAKLDHMPHDPATASSAQPPKTPVEMDGPDNRLFELSS